MATVTVRGEGSIEVAPDAAGLAVEVRQRAAEPGAAHEAAARVAAVVDDLLDEQSAALRRRSTTGLLVTPVHEWRDNGRHFVGWDAVRTTNVEIVDNEAIGTIFARIADCGGRAGALAWIVDPTNPAHTQARTAAAVDARARAEAYAAALGVGLGPVDEIREPSTKDHDTGPMPKFRSAAPMAADMGGGESMAVEAPQLRVDATVDVTFTLTP